MFIETKKEVHIGYILLNRPEKLNALNPQFLEELAEKFFTFDQDPEVKVIVIGSTGPNFCVGADIEALLTMTKDQVSSFIRTGQNLFETIESSAKPVIAAVHGWVLGAGNELACACDLRIAADDSKFGQPEITLGLTPGMGASYRLPKLLNPSLARKLILTGEPITAKEAFAAGLLYKVVKKDTLTKETKLLAHKLTQFDAETFRDIKHLLKKSNAQLETAHFTAAWAREHTQKKIHEFVKR